MQEGAQVGNATLYVDAGPDAFYKSVIWRQDEKAIAELLGA